MKILTRAEQILANRWKTETVETREQGSIRLAKPDAAASMRFREMQKLRQRGETLELESMAFMLQATIVDGRGEAVFPDTVSATRLLAAISTETLTDLVAAAGRLATTEDAEPPAPGKSAAS